MSDKQQGYGECEDCIWYHDSDHDGYACNVKRDSKVCRLNKKPREEI